MDLPKYDQYEQMFGAGPLATNYAMKDMGLAQQFQQQKLEQEKQASQKATLANQFDTENNPMLLEQQRLINTGRGYANDSAGVKARIDKATEGLQLDAAQQKFIKEAKQSDLDQMELQAQKWAYSPDPQQRAQGEQMLKMHKDFIKLREQDRLKADEQKRAYGYSSKLEGQRQAGAQKLQGMKADAKAAAAAGVGNIFERVQSGKVDPAKAAVAFGSAALEAQAKGDLESANLYQNAAAKMEQLANSVKPDTQANKPDMAAVTGLPTIAPRQPTFAQPTPASQGAPIPQDIPSGAKQIGTSKGKPVYELNGKRFILQ
jgi:hypothetical protein